MRRSKPLKPSRKPIARKPVKRRNDARRKKEFARCYGSKERVEWVKHRLCFAVLGVSLCEGKIENAHTENGGMGRKGDASTVIPLCARHHRSLHQIGPDAFQRAYGIDLHTAARLTEEAWQQHAAGV